ncbi:MAG: hypothetical protein OEY22_07975 [Candidatus Bathyarchaeota archaeon]|nr:hypothetical protein [Candidatus Bathyarchaeota archaeon]MDH5787554.1 hypothetical protein [Candidatus Bathyarchaeota archaeon]
MNSINDVYVFPEFRGKGTDERLVVECTKKIEMKGVKTTNLTVLTKKRLQ